MINFRKEWMGRALAVTAVSVGAAFAGFSVAQNYLKSAATDKFYNNSSNRFGGDIPYEGWVTLKGGCGQVLGAPVVAGTLVAEVSLDNGARTFKETLSFSKNPLTFGMSISDAVEQANVPDQKPWLRQTFSAETLAGLCRNDGSKVAADFGQVGTLVTKALDTQSAQFDWYISPWRLKMEWAPEQPYRVPNFSGPRTPAEAAKLVAQ